VHPSSGGAEYVKIAPKIVPARVDEYLRTAFFREDFREASHRGHPILASEHQVIGLIPELGALPDQKDVGSSTHLADFVDTPAETFGSLLSLIS
jgi:hypothetical protein